MKQYFLYAKKWGVALLMENIMLDLGVKSTEKFLLPTEIIGNGIIIKQRSHKFDEDLWQLIDSSRDFLRPFLYWVDDTKSVADVINVTDIFLNNFNNKESFEYVILDKNTQKLVGAGGVHTVSYMHNWAEFGYYIDKTAVGNGYVTEFVNLLSAELFKRNIHRLVITCDVENKASAAVAKRCNFAFEGIMKEARLGYNEYRDQMLFAKINTYK